MTATIDRPETTVATPEGYQDSGTLKLADAPAGTIIDRDGDFWLAVPGADDRYVMRGKWGSTWRLDELTSDGEGRTAQGIERDYGPSWVKAAPEAPELVPAWMLDLLPEGTKLTSRGRYLLIPTDEDPECYAVMSNWESESQARFGQRVADRRSWTGRPIANFDEESYGELVELKPRPAPEPAAPEFAVGQVLNPHVDPEPPLGTVLRHTTILSFRFTRLADGWRLGESENRRTWGDRQWDESAAHYRIESLPVEPTPALVPEFRVGQTFNTLDNPSLPVGTIIRQPGNTADYDREMLASGWGRPGSSYSNFVPMDRWGNRTYEIISLPDAPAVEDQPATPELPADVVAALPAGSYAESDGSSVFVPTAREGWFAVVSLTSGNPVDDIAYAARQTGAYGRNGIDAWRAEARRAPIALVTPVEAPSEPVEAPRMVDGEKVVEVATRLAQDNLGLPGRKVVQDKLIELGLLELKPVPVAGKQIEASTIIEITRQLKNDQSWCGVADKALKEMGAIEPLALAVGATLEDYSDFERVPVGSVVRNNCCRGRLVRIAAGSEGAWHDLANGQTFDMGGVCGTLTIEFVPAD